MAFRFEYPKFIMLLDRLMCRNATKHIFRISNQNRPNPQFTRFLSPLVSGERIRLPELIAGHSFSGNEKYGGSLSGWGSYRVLLAAAVFGLFYCDSQGSQATKGWNQSVN